MKPELWSCLADADCTLDELTVTLGARPSTMVLPNEVFDQMEPHPNGRGWLSPCYSNRDDGLRATGEYFHYCGVKMVRRDQKFAKCPCCGNRMAMPNHIALEPCP